ncbi:unnamed protein product [Closterium sp. NIES-54]
MIGRQDVVLTGHCDSSYADNAETHRSTQGYCFSLGSGAVSWRSTCSSSVSTSTVEAEIYAGAMAAQELRWLTFFLTDLRERPSSAPTLFNDNKATILLCREPRLESRVKHINIRYFLRQELQRRGQARFDFVESEANTTYIFTKALPPCPSAVQHSTVQRTPLAVDHRLTGPFPDETFESSGLYAELVGCLMSTRSPLVSTSTAEAEIYAGAMAAQELCWLTFLLTNLCERPSFAPTLLTDNKASIFLCREPQLESRVKHINVSYGSFIPLTILTLSQRGGPTIQSWVFTMNVFFDANYVESDAAKIRYAFSLPRDPAMDSWRVIVMSPCAYEPPTQEGEPTGPAVTWSSFCETAQYSTWDAWCAWLLFQRVRDRVLGDNSGRSKTKRAVFSHYASKSATCTKRIGWTVMSEG